MLISPFPSKNDENHQQNPRSGRIAARSQRNLETLAYVYLFGRESAVAIEVVVEGGGGRLLRRRCLFLVDLHSHEHLRLLQSLAHLVHGAPRSQQQKRQLGPDRESTQERRGCWESELCLIYRHLTSFFS